MSKNLQLKEFTRIISVICDFYPILLSLSKMQPRVGEVTMIIIFSAEGCIAESNVVVIFDRLRSDVFGAKQRLFLTSSVLFGIYLCWNKMNLFAFIMF